MSPNFLLIRPHGGGKKVVPTKKSRSGLFWFNAWFHHSVKSLLLLLKMNHTLQICAIGLKGLKTKVLWNFFKSFLNLGQPLTHIWYCIFFHIWSSVNQSICIFYRHQLYYTLVCSMFVSNDFSNCSFGYQWQVHSCENFLFVFS